MTDARRVIAVAEGNLAALHCRQHRDVLQVVPERSANPNGMF